MVFCRHIAEFRLQLIGFRAVILCSAQIYFRGREWGGGGGDKKESSLSSFAKKTASSLFLFLAFSLHFSRASVELSSSERQSREKRTRRKRTVSPYSLLVSFPNLHNFNWVLRAEDFQEQTPTTRSLFARSHFSMVRYPIFGSTSVSGQPRTYPSPNSTCCNKLIS